MNIMAKVKIYYRPQTAFPTQFDIIYTSCMGHDNQAELLKTIRHIDKFLNSLNRRRPVKLVEKLFFKDILTSENPGNNSNFNFYIEMRVNRFRNSRTKTFSIVLRVLPF